jgi:hypothetical protein
MLIELIVLALATAIRPASLAALYALLSSTLPRRLMTVYVLAGLAFTITFGVLVIWAFHGISIQAGSSKTKGIAQVAGGILALGFGLFVSSRRVGGRRASDAPAAPGRWSAMLDRHLTIRSAIVAGPATHIPGVFYLIALNLIVASQRQAAQSLVGVLVYNAVWFALPIAALAICFVKPTAAQAAVSAIQTWTTRHARPIMVGVSLAVGTALVIHGAGLL